MRFYGGNVDAEEAVCVDYAGKKDNLRNYYKKSNVKVRIELNVINDSLSVLIFDQMKLVQMTDSSGKQYSTISLSISTVI